MRQYERSLLLTVKSSTFDWDTRRSWMSTSGLMVVRDPGPASCPALQSDRALGQPGAAGGHFQRHAVGSLPCSREYFHLERHRITRAHPRRACHSGNRDVGLRGSPEQPDGTAGEEIGGDLACILDLAVTQCSLTRHKNLLDGAVAENSLVEALARV